MIKLVIGYIGRIQEEKAGSGKDLCYF